MHTCAESPIAPQVLRLCLPGHARGPSGVEHPDFRVGCTAALDVGGAVLSGYCLAGGSNPCIGLQWCSYPSASGHTWTVHLSEQLGVPLIGLTLAMHEPLHQAFARQ